MMHRNCTKNESVKRTTRYTRDDIPTCFRQKTVWTVLLDYLLTAASILGLLTALLFVIVL